MIPWASRCSTPAKALYGIQLHGALSKGMRRMRSAAFSQGAVDVDEAMDQSERAGMPVDFPAAWPKRVVEVGRVFRDGKHYLTCLDEAGSFACILEWTLALGDGAKLKYRRAAARDSEDRFSLSGLGRFWPKEWQWVARTEW